ncbi:sigma-70 family RNA polymerase sigma factor [Microbacterium sp. NPDC056569]|uniref:sigma-70 family RNA polymerase sigma factor n=1 Tax=Microbacterium sp. NPDC056569 TaxID=3345867 RepID=UPI003671A083
MDHEEVQEHETDVVTDADADLVLRTRSGDTDAFAELWRRHYRAGVTVARNMTSSLDADDLVQEAYTRIYHSIVHGGGPTGSFRAYLFTSIRNTAAAWGRARRETAYEELDGVEDPSGVEHESEAALDRGLTHQAFRSLPTRWQEVLWYSEIERMKPAEIAPLLGMKPTAVAQLTFRAREGLREAWIQAHLRSVADGSDCEWTIERLGAYSRLNLGRRDHAKLERHLADCTRCSIVASEAREVSSRLALVLLPIALGAVGTAGYLATVQGGGAPLVALASMPSSIVDGAVTIAPGGVAGAGAGTVTAAPGGVVGAGAGTVTIAPGGVAGAGAAATSAGVGSAGAVGAAGATTAVASSAAVFGTSAVAGIGAASGIAAASLVVVSGVVAAAVMLPAAAAPEPVPSPTPTNNVVAEDAGAPALLADESGDPARQLTAETGPDPADIPVVPAVDAGDAHGDSDAPADGAAGSGGGKATGQTGNGKAEGDSGSTSGNNGSTSGNNGSTSGNNGSTSGNNGSTSGNNGNPTSNNGNHGNGTGNGNGNGNGADSANGTPTNGTGAGNGGVTGNGGSTGNGTPANGTGNGNGGVTGVNRAVPKRAAGVPQGHGRGLADQGAPAPAAPASVEPTAADTAGTTEVAETEPAAADPADGGN